MEKYCEWVGNLKWYEFWKGIFRQPPNPVAGYRTDSSTGLGQIFASTAINALNSYYMEEYGVEPYSKESWKDLRDVWYMLQDDEYNINMVALVLLYKAKCNDVDLSNASIDEIQKVLKAYNGSGEWADKYSVVTLKYYEAFKKFNECGD